MLLRSGKRLLALCILAVMAPTVNRAAVAQSPLVPVSGSPFYFSMGNWSDALALSPDGTHVFVSNQGSDTILVLDAAPDGSLGLPRLFRVSEGRFALGQTWCPNGMAINPAGTRLYVACTDRWSGTGWGNAAVSTLRIESDGSLVWLGDAPLPWPSFAQGGIAYLEMPGGDCVFVNNNAQPGNSVSVLRVDADGKLADRADFPTGGDGSNAGYWVSNSLAVVRAAAGSYLYAMNGADWGGGSNTVSSFRIAPDGSLALLGAPVPLPAGEQTSGPIAVHPAGTALYAATTTGHIVRFAIQPDGCAISPVSYLTGMWPDSHIVAFTVRPGGDYLIATGGASQIAVLETATMYPVLGSPVQGVGSGPDTCVSGGAFNADGTRLFLATMGADVCYWTPIVSAYDFVPQPGLPPYAVTLTADAGQVDPAGVATITGTLAATCPGDYIIILEIRQKTGHRIISGSGSVSVPMPGVNGTAEWSVTVRNDLLGFKGGAAEVTLKTGGTDPLTREWIETNVIQAVKIKPGR